MGNDLEITTERVDDFPVLIESMEKMGLAELVDGQFSVHGNWGGISLGRVIEGWLAHIVSESDHRMSQAEGWAKKCLKMLQSCLGRDVQAEDFTDDRLELVLDRLSEDDSWKVFEAALNQNIVRVYELGEKRVRLDSTTSSGYWNVTEDGLLQYGHSKEGRTDQPQLKVMLSSLDPFGLPIGVQVLSGEKADDPLYIPAIQQVRRGLAKAGLLYVGDSKMMSLGTRAYLQAGGDTYLGPFAKVQVSDELRDAYLQPVWDGTQTLTPIYRDTEDGNKVQIAEGYERTETLCASVDGQQIEWSERRLVVRSLQQAKISETSLLDRLTKAQAALEALNEHHRGKKRLSEVEALRSAAEAIMRRYEVTGLFTLSSEEHVQEQAVRAFGQRPAEMRVKRSVTLHVSRNEQALQAALAHLGWRVYGTNQSKELLPLEQAILAYREEYLIERSFGRLKGKPLTLTPMYLHSEARITGLIRLLSIGLRVLVLLESVVRQRLAEKQTSLAGLYAGNPKRATARPTAEALLGAFSDIYLNTVKIGTQVQYHLTPLSELQLVILQLLGFSPNIYQCLAFDSS